MREKKEGDLHVECAQGTGGWIHLPLGHLDTQLLVVVLVEAIGRAIEQPAVDDAAEEIGAVVLLDIAFFHINVTEVRVSTATGRTQNVH